MVSVILTTYNNEDIIKRTLEKLVWADEIIMIDAFSEDKTPEIGKNFGAKVYQRRWEGYSSQKRYAVELTKFEWILSVDSDEVLDDELISSIKDVISRESKIDGYYMKMVTYFLNQPLRFACRPGYKMRLFKKDKVQLINREVHEHFEVKNAGIIRNGTISHYTSSSIADRINKINIYSTLKAKEIVSEGMKARCFDSIFYPTKSFINSYIIKLGFLDGIYGLIWSILVAMEHFLIYSKARSFKFDVEQRSLNKRKII